MAKRFSDTELWDKEWFMELSAKHKLLLRFLFDRCDVSGVWSPNWTLASVLVGDKVSINDLECLNNQVILLDNGKVFIPGFIKFQYGKLSKDCKPHVPIYKLLEKHGISINSIEMSDEIGKNHNVTSQRKALVLERDGYICCYCGKEKEERNLEIDHVVPRTKGGNDSLDNLVASCSPCNRKKFNFSVKEFCERENLDFEIISKRITERLSQRLSKRLSFSLKEKEEDKEEDKEMEKEEVKEKEKGVQGEKQKPPKPTEPLPIGFFDISECHQNYFDNSALERTREHLCMTHHVSVEVLRDWGDAFNRRLTEQGELIKTFKDYNTHFGNWLKLQDKTKNPKKLFRDEPEKGNSKTGQQPEGNNAAYKRFVAAKLEANRNQG